MEPKDQRSTVRALLTPIIESMGFEVVDIRIVPGARRATLQILADKPGGITLDECARISREVGPILEVEDAVPSAFNLEVGSPGIRRPLTRAEDFERFKGQPAVMKLRQAVDNQRRFKGTLAGAPAPGLVAFTPEGESAPRQFSWNDIEQARLDPEIKV